MFIKRSVAIVFLMVMAYVLPSCEKGSAGKTAPDTVVTRPLKLGKYLIQIEKVGVTNLAPGIAIVSEDGVRYFTAGHWFGTVHDPGSYVLHFEDDVFPVIRVDYIGNDIAELFVGDVGGDAPVLAGVAPTGIEAFDTNIRLARLPKSFDVHLVGTGGRMVCFGSYNTNLGGRENRHGFVCDPGKRVIYDGDSGSPLLDIDGNTFLISGLAEQEINYESSDGSSVMATQMVFIQPLNP